MDINRLQEKKITKNPEDMQQQFKFELNLTSNQAVMIKLNSFF